MGEIWYNYMIKNQIKTPRMDNTQIDPEIQKRLNQPLQNQKGLSAEDQAFLAQVMDKVERGHIKLMIPSSLLNRAVYDKLTPEAQGKADFDAVNLATTLRNIYDLWKAYQVPTYEIENLVHQVRLVKERLEEIAGDIYVI